MGYRKVLIKSYVLVFKIDEVSNIVYVMRFFMVDRIILNCSNFKAILFQNSDVWLIY